MSDSDSSHFTATTESLEWNGWKDESWDDCQTFRDDAVVAIAAYAQTEPRYSLGRSPSPRSLTSACSHTTGHTTHVALVCRFNGLHPICLDYYSFTKPGGMEGSLCQKRASATGKARSLTVDNRVRRRISDDSYVEGSWLCDSRSEDRRKSKELVGEVRFRWLVQIFERLIQSPILLTLSTSSGYCFNVHIVMRCVNNKLTY